MDFHQLHPQDVLIAEALPEYKRSMDFFYLDQLVPLNANIYIIEQILDFPLRVFTRMEDAIFFRLVMTNFYFASLLAITRLATDQGSDFHTLPQFKNWVLKQVKHQYRRDFQAHLRETRFDKQTRKMFEKAKYLRDARVAHIKRDTSLLQEDQPNFGELKALRDTLNSLLDSLSFNVHHAMLPLQYLPGTSGIWDPRSDIERLLDCIAKESPLLNMPEDAPERWQLQRERLSTEQLEAINKYRVKFGLNAV